MFDHIETLSIKEFKCFYGNLDEGCKISLKVLSRSEDINIILCTDWVSMKWNIFTKWNVYHHFKRFSHLFWSYRGRHREMFSGKAVLKTSSRFTGEHPTPGILLAKSTTYMKREIRNIPWWFFFLKKAKFESYYGCWKPTFWIIISRIWFRHFRAEK